MNLEQSEAIRAYINKEKSEQYYEEAFAKYAAAGVDQFQWHWSWWAMFGGIFYLLYRKLYLEALVYFLLFAIVGMIPFMGLIMWVASGGILPYFVYKRYKKTLAQVEENLSTKEEQLQALRTVGGVNQWAIWLAIVIHVIAWAGFIYTSIMIASLSPGIQHFGG